MHHEKTRRGAAAPPAGRDGVPPLRRPLRQGRLPRRVPGAGLPVRLLVQGVGSHVRRLHAEDLRRRDRPRHAARGRAPSGGLRRDPRGAPAAADVPDRGGADLRVALRGARAASTRSSASCPSASRRSASSRSSRPAEQRVLAAAPHGRARSQTSSEQRRAARRARARRRRRSRSSGTRRRAPCSGPWPGAPARPPAAASSAAGRRSRSARCGSSPPRPRWSARSRRVERRDLRWRAPRSAAAPARRAALQARDRAVGRVDLRLEILDRDVLADDRAERGEPATACCTCVRGTRRTRSA